MKIMVIMILLVSIIGCGNNTEIANKDSEIKKMSTNENLEKSNMTFVGGWKINAEMPACQLPEEVEAAFNEAKIMGAKYVPVLYVGSQLVSGMNYMLICKQTLATQEQSEGVVQMTIYKPLNGPAVITEINPILNYKFTN